MGSMYTLVFFRVNDCMAFWGEEERAAEGWTGRKPLDHTEKDECEIG